MGKYDYIFSTDRTDWVSEALRQMDRVEIAGKPNPVVYSAPTEEDWEEWKRTLPSKFLRKNPPGRRANARKHDVPEIVNVVFNPPATIIFWADKSKTVVKAEGRDVFSREAGLAMAIAKKALGNKSNYYNEIRKWVGLNDEQKKTAVELHVVDKKSHEKIAREIGMPKKMVAAYLKSKEGQAAITSRILKDLIDEANDMLNGKEDKPNG